jgi:uncharacterized protein (DUF2147 family)
VEKIMKKITVLAILTAIGAMVLMAACTPKPSADDVAASQAAESAAMSVTAAQAASQAVAEAMTSVDATGYVGKWTGPEGTAMTITPAGSAYEVVITNLDGPRTFSGPLEGDGIHITRDGSPLVIHKGDGPATGMKWLADKHDCLVVAANEGFCKD